MKEKITPSSGNIFVDLGFPPEEIAILTMRSTVFPRFEIRSLYPYHDKK